MKMLWKRVQRLAQHRYGFTMFAFLIAAAMTGLSCVVFMRGFDVVLHHRLDATRIGMWSWATTPIIFLAAAELIRLMAPCAGGSGIPQAIFAAKHLGPTTEAQLWPLFSIQTLVVKVIAILLALYAGASLGREGPTVHIGVCVFMIVLLGIRRWVGLSFDSRSAIVAGGAAGLAAAFNTPLAGVTFAIEELTGDTFSGIKDFVLMAIIVAALTAKTFTGEYGYFGRLLAPPDVPWQAILFIGVVGGCLGAFFSTAVLRGLRAIQRLPLQGKRYGIPLGMGLILVVVSHLSAGRVLGPGNEVAQGLLRGEFQEWVQAYPFAKLLATLLTYWAGMAGGIFAPSLSIGAGLGATLGHWMHLSIAGCALLGMAAFLSATIQAPITTFVIIFEMTGHHQMLLPVMLASLIAFMTARLLGAAHLYGTLSHSYGRLLGKDPTSEYE